MPALLRGARGIKTGAWVPREQGRLPRPALEWQECPPSQSLDLPSVEGRGSKYMVVQHTQYVYRARPPTDRKERITFPLGCKKNKENIFVTHPIGLPDDGGVNFDKHVIIANR